MNFPILPIQYLLDFCLGSSQQCAKVRICMFYAAQNSMVGVEQLFLVKGLALKVSRFFFLPRCHLGTFERKTIRIDRGAIQLSYPKPKRGYHCLFSWCSQPSWMSRCLLPFNTVHLRHPGVGSEWMWAGPFRMPFLQWCTIYHISLGVKSFHYLLLVMFHFYCSVWWYFCFLLLQPIGFISVVYLSLFGDSVNNIFRLSQIFISAFYCLSVKLLDIQQWHGDSVLYLQTFDCGGHATPPLSPQSPWWPTNTHNKIYSGYSGESSQKIIKMGQRFPLSWSLACSHLYSKHC